MSESSIGNLRAAETIIKKKESVPSGYHLIVSTSRSVYIWNMHGIREVFRSKTGGIVAVKSLGQHRNTIAIADGHIVVLHKVDGTEQRTHRLHANEGQLRLLKFGGGDCDSLFFTTNLANTVQVFSLQDHTLSGSHDLHTVPPTVFALSHDSRFLISASPQPSTIYLRLIKLGGPPAIVRPKCSSSAVVAATFHPETAYIFLLAFADGTLALYDARRYFDTSGKLYQTSLASHDKNELASILGLHARVPGGSITTADSRSTRATENKHRTIPVQASATTITSAVLVPGKRALAVTIGSDGRCCVVDFTQPSKEKAILLKSWNLRRPATSLSIIKYHSGWMLDTSTLEKDYPSSYCIAVGRYDGKVRLFDLEGNQIGQNQFGSKRRRIIDVEWCEDIHTNKSDHTLHAKLVDKPVSSITSSEVGREYDQQKQLEDCFPSQDDVVKDLHGRNTTRHNELQPPLNSPYQDAGPSTELLSNSPPPVPPRPSPRFSGPLAQRRALLDRQKESKDFSDEYAIYGNMTAASVDDAFGSNLPCEHQSTAVHEPMDQAVRNSKTPSNQGTFKMKSQEMAVEIPPDSIESNPVLSVKIFYGSPNFVDENTADSVTDDLAMTMSPVVESVSSYQTAPIVSMENTAPNSMSRAPSDDSIDTVIDWNVGKAENLNHQSRIYKFLTPIPSQSFRSKVFRLHKRTPSMQSKEAGAIVQWPQYPPADIHSQASPPQPARKFEDVRATVRSGRSQPQINSATNKSEHSLSVASATAIILATGQYTDSSSVSSLDKTRRCSRDDAASSMKMPESDSPTKPILNLDHSTRQDACLFAVGKKDESQVTPDKLDFPQPGNKRPVSPIYSHCYGDLCEGLSCRNLVEAANLRATVREEIEASMQRQRKWLMENLVSRICDK